MVKIAVLGGGPAGLYLSVLMKKARPDCEVVVVERNRRDDTRGWGVVFSDGTLGNLQRADPESYAAITESFVHWDAIETHFKGEVIRSGGYGSCGISRSHLLQILQERAERLGVRLLYQRDHAGLADEVTEAADLVVAADGVNSRVRAELAHVFRPSIEEGKSKYIWLGTTKKLDASTFFIRDDERGFFTVHAYPFDANTSNFVIETDVESWRRAGLDRMSVDEGLAFCEQLFAEELAGHRLLSQSPQHGYSHHVPHRGCFYHVQTEDHGTTNPYIFTEISHDGMIIATNLVSWTSIAADDVKRGDEIDAVVVAAMQESHKSMIRQLHSGAFDERIVNLIGAHPNASNEPESGPAGVLTNKSSWLSFRTISCERWWHGNVVLIGDAAHTAHFSFGAGTKLAMEDSIALADALQRHDDVPAALQAYQDARWLEVAELQRSARVSQAWFEDIRHYRDTEPQQLVLSMMSRSERVHDENLRVRDRS